MNELQQEFINFQRLTQNLITDLNELLSKTTIEQAVKEACHIYGYEWIKNQPNDIYTITGITPHFDLILDVSDWKEAVDCIRVKWIYYSILEIEGWSHGAYEHEKVVGEYMTQDEALQAFAKFKPTVTPDTVIWHEIVKYRCLLILDYNSETQELKLIQLVRDDGLITTEEANDDIQEELYETNYYNLEQVK